jgi:dihydrofolate reductase
MINGHGVYIIVAADEKNGIGKNRDLPWRLKSEMAYFKQRSTATTDPEKQNLVIMGRTTWESIPEKYRPLPDRKNVVLTREADYPTPGGFAATSFDEAFALADDRIENIYVIGGASVYEQAVQRPELDGVYLTRIHGTFDCDTFFPEIRGQFPNEQKLGADREGDVEYDYLLYTKAPAQ